MNKGFCTGNHWCRWIGNRPYYHPGESGARSSHSHPCLFFFRIPVHQCRQSAGYIAFSVSFSTLCRVLSRICPGRLRLPGQNLSFPIWKPHVELKLLSHIHKFPELFRIKMIFVSCSTSVIVRKQRYQRGIEGNVPNLRLR